MQIHVARNSAQLGIFSSEEIVAGLQSGRFLATDLAWRDGLSGWSPLGDWAEFRVTGVPSSPSAMPAESVITSTIPWEQGKSLSSFFATVKLAIANPSSLSTGRFAFGDWLVFCYVALAISLPFQAVRLAFDPDPSRSIAEFLKGFSSPALQAVADQMLKSPPTPIGLTIISTVIGLAFAPLMYAFCALPHWVGQRVFRIQVSVERTVAATLLATGVLILLMAPFQLLAFNVVAQIVVSSLSFIPAMVVYFRCFGAATGVSPWKQFGISNLVWFVLCCCCCFLPMMVAFGLPAMKALGR
jgi:hypothetical protein